MNYLSRWRYSGYAALAKKYPIGAGVTRKALSELLNGHSGVSPEMALRLAAAGWSASETWLQMQLAHDLWQVRNRVGELGVRRFTPPAAA